MRPAMRIADALRLRELNALSEPGPGSAARAWFAEVSAASWSDDADLRVRFPSVLISGNRLLFDLGDGGQCVIALVNYDVQVVLVRYCGPLATAPWPSWTPSRTRRKR
ncbi:MAG: type II toxin-antitoxin system HigB family toxin [Janthinobacterium lividum]